MIDTLDAAILALILILTACYFYFQNKSQKPVVTLAPANGKSLINYLEALNEPNLVVLFYGSQTGTAEDFCSRISQEFIKKLSLKTICLDPDDYDMTELQQIGALGNKWICGYGEGEPTDNSQVFYDWVMNSRGCAQEDPEDDEMTGAKVCDSLPYFVFGLGNRTYEYYNVIGSRLDARLLKLGGQRVVPYGDGDDDGRLEEDFLKWKITALANVSKYYGIDIDTSSQKGIPHVQLYVEKQTQQALYSYLTAGPPRSWKNKEDMSDSLIPTDIEDRTITPLYDVKNPYYAKVSKSIALFGETHDVSPIKAAFIPSDRVVVQNNEASIARKCYHVEIELGESGFTYTSGDHLGVWGDNSDVSVRRFADIMNLNLDDIFYVAPNPDNDIAADIKEPFPMPCKIRTALQSYMDIDAVVKQHHFEVPHTDKIISKYAKVPAERNALWELSENRPLFLRQCVASQKTLADIVQQYPSVMIPRAVVLTELLGRIAVRYYSISSSPKECSSKVSITAVVVRYPITQDSSQGEQTVFKHGLTTSAIERIHEKLSDGPSYLPIFLRHSSFKLPEDHSLPIIMVGPGTGIAPFRGFIRERMTLAMQGQTVGPTWLFYGCRNSESVY